MGAGRRGTFLPGEPPDRRTLPPGEGGGSGAGPRRGAAARRSESRRPAARAGAIARNSARRSWAARGVEVGLRGGGRVVHLEIHSGASGTWRRGMTSPRTCDTLPARRYEQARPWKLRNGASRSGSRRARSCGMWSARTTLAFLPSTRALSLEVRTRDLVNRTTGAFRARRRTRCRCPRGSRCGTGTTAAGLRAAAEGSAPRCRPRRRDLLGDLARP